MASEDDTRDGGVLSGLSRTRPQRRSERRKPTAAKPARAKAAGRPAKPRAQRTSKAASSPRAPKVRSATPRASASAAKADAPRPLRQPAQPRNVPPQPDRAAPAEPETVATEDGHHVVGTAIQAAGELAQIGLTVGTQVVRGALSRLPRP